MGPVIPIADLIRNSPKKWQRQSKPLAQLLELKSLVNTILTADNNDVHWTSWTAWSVCTGVDGKDCGPGHRILRRECRRDRGGQLCQIDGRQEDYRNEDCFLKPCPPPPGELEICLSSHYCPVPAELKLGQSVPMVPRS